MEIVNKTPFQPFVFEFQDQDKDDHFIVIVRGTFKIENGSPLVPCQEQSPIVTADEYQGEPLKSPLQRESDLCPVKLNTDVFVIGDAVAPGQGAKSWTTAVQIDGRRTELKIFGPRNWERLPLVGWKLTEPKTVQRVSLDYSHAFGGTITERDGNEVSFPGNPIGKGFSTAETRSRDTLIPAPQIECPNNPIIQIGEEYAPKCFAPIPRAWPQRLQLAGTYDDAWLENKWPVMPDDFDPYFFNAAHPELQLENDLKGGERFRLEGFHNSGPVEFKIPDYKLIAEIVDEFGTATVGCSLDTVEIDTRTWQVGMVWRASDLKLNPVEKVNLSMTGSGVIQSA